MFDTPMYLAQEPTQTETGFPERSELNPGLLTDLASRLSGGNELVVSLTRNVVEPGLRVAVILVVAWIALRLIRRAIRHFVEEAKDPEPGIGHRLGKPGGWLTEGKPGYSMRRAQRADALGALFSSIAGVVVWTIVILSALGTFGWNLGPFIAGAGILGVALGFGAQDLVKDFLSGVFMLVEDQYGVGDVIDVGEALGVVEGVSLRTTRVRDVTGTLWHIPNGEIARVGNMSHDWARALLDIGVAYGSDADEVAEIIKAVADTMAREETYREIFLAEPEIWGVQDLGPDSVDIRLVIKTKPGEQWAITRELRRRIKLAFDQAEVEIPFPQRTVWLRSEVDGRGPAPTPREKRAARDPSAPSAAQGKAAAEEGAIETSDHQTEAPSPEEPEAERSDR